jgi:hypothetical protein
MLWLSSTSTIATKISPESGTSSFLSIRRAFYMAGGGAPWGFRKGEEKKSMRVIVFSVRENKF